MPCIRTISDYLRCRASRVWDLQEDALRHKLWLQEETLTERLLLRMAKDAEKHGFCVTMFNKRQEGGYKQKGGHGADWQWEWFLRTENCEKRAGLLLRIQAKRLLDNQKGGEYDIFDSKEPGSRQIDKLISNAKNKEHEQECKMPVYLFYNHGQVAGNKYFDSNSEYFGGDKNSKHQEQSFWGCAIASAHFVKKKKQNKLSEVIKGMVPWHCLVSKPGQFELGALVDSETVSLIEKIREKILPSDERTGLLQFQYQNRGFSPFNELTAFQNQFLSQELTNLQKLINLEKLTLSSRPKWSEYLDFQNGTVGKSLSSGKNEGPLQDYLRKHELAGVAELNFSNFQPQDEENPESIKG